MIGRCPCWALIDFACRLEVRFFHLVNHVTEGSARWQISSQSETIEGLLRCTQPRIRNWGRTETLMHGVIIKWETHGYIRMSRIASDRSCSPRLDSQWE